MQGKEKEREKGGREDLWVAYSGDVRDLMLE